MGSPKKPSTASPHLTSVRPAPSVGIIGGGQLSRMLCLAATQLGLRTVTVERTLDCPAATVSGQHLVGDWNDPAVLAQVASLCDVITLENEFVHAEALASLETSDHSVLPSSRCLEAIQDKLRQKETLRSADLPTPPFQSVDTLDALQEAAEKFGFPFVLKRRRNGYDGKGNVTVASAAELETAWKHLDGTTNPLFAEAFCHFRAELAIMVCRRPSGDTIVYPVVETVQKNHICHLVTAPAQIEPAVEEAAIRVATAATTAFDGIGCLGVELFLTKEKEIVVNELAPRVHNSGHYTMEACTTSQFENHIRAVLDLPLGSPQLVRPCAVMINLLGDAPGPAFPQGVAQALEVDGAHLHLYAKDQSQLGRKMGHLTVVGDKPESTLDQAQRAANAITFQSA